MTRKRCALRASFLPIAEIPEAEIIDGSACTVSRYKRLWLDNPFIKPETALLLTALCHWSITS